MKAGEFNTMKTAQNTWGKIKNKLPKCELVEGGGGDEDAGKNPPPFAPLQSVRE